MFKSNSLRGTIFAYFSLIFTFTSSITPTLAAEITDISFVNPQSTYIKELVDSNTFKLDESGNFFPDKLVSRAQFLKAAFTYSGYTPPATMLQTGFIDVPVESWFSPYVKKALEIRAITPSTDGYFQPAGTISRQEALIMALAIYGLPISISEPSSENLFDDIRPTRTYSSFFQTAYLLNINFDSNPDLIEPAKLLTKADAAEMLYKTRLAADYLNQVTGTISIPSVTNISTDNYGLTETELKLLESEEFTVFLDVWNRIHSQYINNENVIDSLLIDSAISGMVNALEDPYSAFVGADENGESFIYLPDKYEGIGIVVEKINEKFIIQTTINNSPAYRAGLQTGDIIVEIEGRSISEINTENISDLIKGPAGTILHLKIERNSQIYSYEITRETIDIDSLHYQVLNNNINYLRIDQFTENSYNEFKTQLEKIKQSGSKKLIIDLRNNPGGYVSTTQEILGHFLKSEQISFFTQDNTGAISPFYSGGAGDLSDYQIVVIINEGSASAAEIMAGALQDNSLAKIIGNPSYGKGSVQQITNYTNNSSLKLTVAKWLTPKQNDIHPDGIQPDQIVTITEQQRQSGIDPQRDLAISLLR